MDRLRALRSAVQGFRLLSLVLIVCGVALLAYVGYSYYTMWSAQRQLAREFEVQQKRAVEAPNPIAGAAPLDDGLTRLTIPKINLTAVVVEGTTHKKLLLGPGHMEKTARPGEDGNAVITAHRDTFFRHIYELNKGDILTVQRSGQTYNYAVTAKKIVDPNDTSVVEQTEDPRLTLITCYPTYYIGPAPERLVVFSKRINDANATAVK